MFNEGIESFFIAIVNGAYSMNSLSMFVLFFQVIEATEKNHSEKKDNGSSPKSVCALYEVLSNELQLSWA